MNFPLYLTLSRIFLGPIFIAVYLYYERLGIPLRYLPYALLAITLISELSDIFDGFLARRRNQVTELGKILDPMADSIFRFSTLCAFTQGFLKIPLLLVLVFFYRDSIISALRTICALRGFALAARVTGKVKAIILATMAFLILILMIPYSLGIMSLQTLQRASYWSVGLVALYVIYTGFEYIYANRQYIKKAFRI